jgi:hypothetical protein
MGAAGACANAVHVVRAGETMKRQVADVVQPRPLRGIQARAQLSLHEIKDMQAMNVVQPDDVKKGRPEHKFQKKPQKHAKVPGRVLAKAGVSPYGGFDVEV